LLYNPIAITGTPWVGAVWDAMSWYAVTQGFNDSFLLPVVAETYDGWLSDRVGELVSRQNVINALNDAHSGPIAEGCVGGGTGMICHEFKGGTGTSSRIITAAGASYTVGVLVQANYGTRADLRIDGVPVGRAIPTSEIPSGWSEPTYTPGDGSIIVIIATDAPLTATGCDRLAQRATVGLARTGGYGHNGSGDLFVAFSTGNELHDNRTQLEQIRVLPPSSMDQLFHGVADAVEEAIANALCAATTITGFNGRTAYALPKERMQALVRAAGFSQSPQATQPLIDTRLP
jgi:D-aminopeptidase